MPNVECRIPDPGELRRVNHAGLKRREASWSAETERSAASALAGRKVAA